MNNPTKNPILAICYDFDKTLSPDDMQAQGYIQSVGSEVKAFWKESNSLAKDNEMDQNLAYMYLMATKARGKLLFKRETLNQAGRSLQLFPGVETWFNRINAYGEEHGITVEHYIISSGLKEMIEGTTIADNFKKIYASSFYYDTDGVAVWPAQAVNYTNKTQFLFRIEKGVLDINDQQVNKYFKPGELRVPFRNIVYIGDSDTDIPCMKLVNLHGGHSIGVFNSETQDKSKVYRMLDADRIKYFTAADYTENSELEGLLKNIINRTKANEILEKIHYSCIDDKDTNTSDNSDFDSAKEDLIYQLEASSCFARTHQVIAQLTNYSDWLRSQKVRLMRIAISNSQVSCILNDSDVKDFFLRVINGDYSKEAGEIRKRIGVTQ